MHTKGHSSAGSTAAAPASAHGPHSLEHLLQEDAPPEQFSAGLAKIFRVRSTEVALLKLERGALKFIFPSELATAGSVPLSSSSAVAARTAITKKTEFFNGFAKVKHANIFESVRLGKPEDMERTEQAPIQKLVSCPIIDHKNQVVGVVQICRKGFDQPTSGPDFTPNDSQRLEHCARILARATFMKKD
jgi:hypothetical protein